jgi:hypothetical protein
MTYFGVRRSRDFDFNVFNSNLNSVKRSELLPYGVTLTLLVPTLLTTTPTPSPMAPLCSTTLLSSSHLLRRGSWNNLLGMDFSVHDTALNAKTATSSGITFKPALVRDSGATITGDVGTGYNLKTICSVAAVSRTMPSIILNGGCCDGRNPRLITQRSVKSTPCLAATHIVETIPLVLRTHEPFITITSVNSNNRPNGPTQRRKPGGYGRLLRSLGCQKSPMVVANGKVRT